MSKMKKKRSRQIFFGADQKIFRACKNLIISIGKNQVALKQFFAKFYYN